MLTDAVPPSPKRLDCLRALLALGFAAERDLRASAAVF
jgi:hypothetical protein